MGRCVSKKGWTDTWDLNLCHHTRIPVESSHRLRVLRLTRIIRAVRMAAASRQIIMVVEGLWASLEITPAYYSAQSHYITFLIDSRNNSGLAGSGTVLAPPAAVRAPVASRVGLPGSLACSQDGCWGGWVLHIQVWHRMLYDMIFSGMAKQCCLQ